MIQSIFLGLRHNTSHIVDTVIQSIFLGLRHNTSRILDTVIQSIFLDTTYHALWIQWSGPWYILKSTAHYIRIMDTMIYSILLDLSAHHALWLQWYHLVYGTTSIMATMIPLGLRHSNHYGYSDTPRSLGTPRIMATVTLLGLSAYHELWLQSHS